MDATTYKWKELPKPGDKVIRIWDSSSNGKMIQGNTYTVKKAGISSLFVEEVDESWTTEYFAPANIIVYEIY